MTDDPSTRRYREALRFHSLLLENPITLENWVVEVRIDISVLADLLEISRTYIYLLISGKRSASENLQNQLAYLSYDKIINKCGYYGMDQR